MKSNNFVTNVNSFQNGTAKMYVSYLIFTPRNSYYMQLKSSRVECDYQMLGFRKPPPKYSQIEENSF